MTAFRGTFRVLGSLARVAYLRVGSGGRASLVVDVLPRRLEGSLDQRAVRRGGADRGDHRAVLVVAGPDLHPVRRLLGIGRVLGRFARAADTADDALQRRTGGVPGDVEVVALVGRGRDPGDRPDLRPGQPAVGEHRCRLRQLAQRPGGVHPFLRGPRTDPDPPRQPVLAGEEPWPAPRLPAVELANQCQQLRLTRRHPPRPGRDPVSELLIRQTIKGIHHPKVPVGCDRNQSEIAGVQRISRRRCQDRSASR